METFARGPSARDADTGTRLRTEAPGPRPSGIPTAGALLSLFLAVGPAVAQTWPAEGSAVESITADDLRVRIGALAHDSMRGRDTPSPELEETARYVATKFRTFGLRPAIGEEYIQTYPITTVEAGPAAVQRLSIRGPSGRTVLDPRRDFVVVPVAARAEGSGPLTVVAAGADPGDIRGRVAVVRASQQEMRGGLVEARELLEEGGAAAALLVVDASREYLAGLRSFLQGRGQVSLGEPRELPAPLAIVPESALPAPLAAALRAGPTPPDWSASLHTEATIRTATGLNTIGWIPGSDAELADEYVFFTAHMDHVGVGRPVAGDSIYNGADDNASGTATIVELAQAFSRTEPAPKRSLVFMTVSGEEKGLWGSRWYSEHPVFPLERTVADLNIDMIGRNWRDTVVAIGKEESSLGPLVDRIAGDHPELGLAVIDDPWPEERFYFRSDHYNFARKGVPILFFFSGVHDDYHRPSDEAGKIRYDKAARIGRLIYLLGKEIADAPERPEWDPEAYRRVVEEEGGR